MFLRFCMWSKALVLKLPVEETKTSVSDTASCLAGLDFLPTPKQIMLRQHLRNIRLYCSVSHQTHHNGGAQKITVNTTQISTTSTSNHKTTSDPKSSSNQRHRAMRIALWYVQCCA